MKTLKIFGALALAIITFSGASAQQGALKVELNYTVGLPMGSLSDYVDGNTSWRGGEIVFMYSLSDRASLGLQVGMQDFYKRYPREVIHSSGSDFSAVITNSVNVMPILLKGKYDLAPMGAVRPFVGLGVGGNLVEYRKYYGEFVDSRAKFGFAAQPSVGVHVPFGKSSRAGFHLAAGYNFMPFKYNEIDGLNHAVIKAGLSFPLQQ